MIHKSKRLFRILSGPFAGGYFIPKPSSIFFVVSNRCNSRCATCNIWKKPKVQELSVGDIRRIFQNPFFRNTEELILTGGEPTLRTELREITETLVDCLPRLRSIALLTNGYSTTRILNIAKDILENSSVRKKNILFLVQVSLDGIMGTHDSIRGVKGAFASATNTIQQLKELSTKNDKLLLGLHCVVQERNLDELEELRSFSERLDIPIFFSPIVISNNYFQNDNKSEGEFLKQEQLDLVESFLNNLSRNACLAEKLYYEDTLAMLNGAKRQRKCVFGLYRIYVDANGDVYHCLNDNMAPLINLQSSSISEVWYSPKANQWRSEARKATCPSCMSGCYIDLMGWRELVQYLGLRIKNLSK